MITENLERSPLGRGCSRKKRCNPSQKLTEKPRLSITAQRKWWGVFPMVRLLTNCHTIRQQYTKKPQSYGWFRKSPWDRLKLEAIDISLLR